MRNTGSHRPSGHFADLTKRARNRVVKKCPMCGAGLADRRKTFCSPCYDARLEARLLARCRAAKLAIEDGTP